MTLDEKFDATNARILTEYARGPYGAYLKPETESILTAINAAALSGESEYNIPNVIDQVIKQRLTARGFSVDYIPERTGMDYAAPSTKISW